MAELTLARVVLELLSRHPDACVVSTCGYPTRELFAAADRPGNLYLVGSMGMAAPVALGIALARPDRQVIAIDGDGSLLMNLGVLPLVASARARLVHVVVDNGMHESTGGQSTVQRADFARLALAAGYRSALRIETTVELGDADVSKPPVLLQALVPPRDATAFPRVTHSPHEIVRRVHAALNPVEAAAA
jgi:sulfopyruvate decarboxylase subunit beta